MKLQKRQTNSHLYQDKGKDSDSEQKEIEEQCILDNCTVREDELENHRTAGGA